MNKLFLIKAAAKPLICNNLPALSNRTMYVGSYIVIILREFLPVASPELKTPVVSPENKSGTMVLPGCRRKRKPKRR
jgi:hypothetical protein